LVKIQIDVDKELNKMISMFRGVRGLRNRANAVVQILREYFEMGRWNNGRR